MTSEEKQILLNNLRHRLYTKTKCQCTWADTAKNGSAGVINELDTYILDELEMIDDPDCEHMFSDIKPYLRPMSSMTKEEKALYSNYQMVVRKLGLVFEYNVEFTIEWLIEHHLDFSGLIDRGLALAAPEGMYDRK